MEEHLEHAVDPPLVVGPRRRVERAELGRVDVDVADQRPHRHVWIGVALVALAVAGEGEGVRRDRARRHEDDHVGAGDAVGEDRRRHAHVAAEAARPVGHVEPADDRRGMANAAPRKALTVRQQPPGAARPPSVSTCASVRK